ncbi:MAG TPA: hypothetical protein VNA04_14115 [Thermoanaerobaculia bacterium]|nr:hypothetical protein [Thermoanaerobaculia bacterium]
MSGARLLVGSIVMAVVVPITIFLLLGLDTFAQLFTIAACTFLAWGVADLLARILEKPRLEDRTPRRALDEEFDRRSGGD